MEEQQIMSKITVHHVGARSGCGGSRSLLILNPMLSTCCMRPTLTPRLQIKETNSSLPSTLHVVPQCLGKSPGIVEFNIKYDPHLSSIYECDQDFGSFYQLWSGCDYICKKFVRHGKRVVPVDSLDNVLSKSRTLLPLQTSCP